MAKYPRKRLVALGDTHCGSVVGLTPPIWQPKSMPWLPFRGIQKELWRWFAQQIEELKPIDILLVNGDGIEGKGRRSGGADVFVPGLKDQATMLANVLGTVEAQAIIMTEGTEYHANTEDGENLEEWAANEVGAQIHERAFLEVNGNVIDARHFVGSSSIPHGRFTAAAREHFWNVVQAARGEAPEAGIILRSHVHYHNYCGGPGWLAMTLPALQGPGTKFGKKKCSGVVDFGLVVFDFDENGGYRWEARTLELKARPADLIKC